MWTYMHNYMYIKIFILLLGLGPVHYGLVIQKNKHQSSVIKIELNNLDPFFFIFNQNNVF